MNRDSSAVRVVVTGGVQGVSFRETCRREAEARGVAGWVRNRDDGSVEAEFVGPPADVRALVAWCRTGPSAAVVDDVTCEPVDAPAESRGFEVR